MGGLPPHLENAIDHLGVLTHHQNGSHMEERRVSLLGLGQHGCHLSRAPDETPESLCGQWCHSSILDEELRDDLACSYLNRNAIILSEK